jgi:hypothetical protein
MARMVAPNITPNVPEAQPRLQGSVDQSLMFHQAGAAGCSQGNRRLGSSRMWHLGRRYGAADSPRENGCRNRPLAEVKGAMISETLFESGPR